MHVRLHTCEDGSESSSGLPVEVIAGVAAAVAVLLIIIIIIIIIVVCVIKKRKYSPTSITITFTTEMLHHLHY